MDSRQMFDEHHLQKWAEIVRRCNESGMTKRAFCESIGIKENTYYYWQKRVRDAVCEQLLRLREDFGIVDQAQALDVLPQTQTYLAPSTPEQDFAEVIVHEVTSCTHEVYEAHEAGGVHETNNIHEAGGAPVQSSQPLEQSKRGQIRIEAEGFNITADSSYPTSQLAELLKGLVQL